MRCIRCGLCTYICPSKIDLEEIILHLRTKVTEEYGMGVVKNIAFKAVMNNRGLFHTMVRAASKLKRPVTEKKHQIFFRFGRKVFPLYNNCSHARVSAVGRNYPLNYRLRQRSNFWVPDAVRIIILTSH